MRDVYLRCVNGQTLKFASIEPQSRPGRLLPGSPLYQEACGDDLGNIIEKAARALVGPARERG